MNALRKAMATLITAITLAGSADAGDRLPVELLGCWKWHGSDGPRLSNAVYHRNQVSAENCKGSDNMLIFSDRYGMNNGDGEIDCRLRSVIFRETRPVSVPFPVRRRADLHVDDDA